MSNSDSRRHGDVGRRHLVQGVLAGAAAVALGGVGAVAFADRLLPEGGGRRRTTDERDVEVEVASTGDRSWQLLVRGRPWYVRGVAYGFPQGEVGQHLDDLAELGVNTLRTYSADPEQTAVLLDAAAARGMRVVVGFWLRQDADYREGSADAAYLESALTEVVTVAEALAHHAGVLLWDVGNEVMGMVRGGSPADRDQRRAAYAAYVERVAVALHEADPQHPVTSTDSSTSMWKHYRDHAPSLDLLAVNAYKAVGKVAQVWRRDGHDRPYLVTETGAAGDWEVPKGPYGVPEEGADDDKAEEFTAAWRAVLDGGGASLGGTVFGYNSVDTYIGMWRYLFVGGDRRPTWYALQRSLTGAGGPRPLGVSATPPEDTDLRPGQTFSVGVRAEGTTAAAASFEVRMFRYDAVRDGSYAVQGRNGLVSAASRRVAAGRLEVTAPQEEGVWKVYVIAKDGQGGASVAPLAVRVSGDAP